MNNLNFWNQWRRRYRSVYQMLLFVFAASIIYSFYAQFNTNELSAPLEIVRKTESIELSLKNVHDFVFDLPIPSRTYVVFQGFLALKSGFSLSSTYFLIAVIFCCFSILMTVSTYLSRLWFMIFQSIFVVWIITLKLQYLKILGFDNQSFTFIFIALILLVGYYFHSFNKDAGLFKRWVAFAFILIALMTLVVLGATVEAPVVFMAHHGIIVPIVLSIIFIFNIAYEVVLHVLFLLASKKNSDESSNLIHFIVICLLYFTYLGLTFAGNEFTIRWDIVYLNEFILLAISAVLGIWGFKKRSELIEKQLSFRPLGAYVYLVLAIMTFSLIAWVFHNGNDPLVETFEDMIIFSHIGFGVLFFFYVLYNFVALLKAGHGIYPVVFRPVNIPYYLVRPVGFGLVIVMILRVSYLPYYQAIAGYYNGLADFYEYIGQEENAETTYKIARQYAKTNHKSNFKIGQREYADKEWVQAAAYFGQANYKKPSVQAYVNRAQAQLNASLIFESLFTLQAGQKDFPDNPQLLNMIGLVYEELNKTDSAFIYFDAAKRAAVGSTYKDLSSANTTGLFAKKGIDEDLLSQQVIANKSSAYKANYLALANRKRFFADSMQILQSSIPASLTYNDFSFLFNYTLNKALGQKNFTEDTIRWLGELQPNEAFSKSIDYAAAVRLNYAAEVKEGMGLIYNLYNAEISDAGFYYLIHGFWLMDQQAYEMAEEMFVEAEKLKMPKATTYRVICLIYEGRLFEAAQLYEKQFDSKGIDSQYMQTDPLYQFLLGDPSDLSDSFLYLWLRTNSSLQEDDRQAILSQLEDSPFKLLYQLDQAEKSLKQGDFEQAKELLLTISIPENETGIQIKYQNLLAALVSYSADESLEEQVDSNKLSVYPYNYQLLWKAYLSSKTSADSNVSEDLMYQLGIQNPYFELGVLFAADFFSALDQNEVGYELLVEAIRLNSNSTNLLKAYTLQALRINMSGYAAESLDELEYLLSKDEWEEFRTKYEALKAEIDSLPW